MKFWHMKSTMKKDITKPKEVSSIELGHDNVSSRRVLQPASSAPQLIKSWELVFLLQKSLAVLLEFAGVGSSAYLKHGGGNHGTFVRMNKQLSYNMPLHAKGFAHFELISLHAETGLEISGKPTRFRMGLPIVICPICNGIFLWAKLSHSRAIFYSRTTIWHKPTYWAQNLILIHCKPYCRTLIHNI